MAKPYPPTCLLLIDALLDKPRTINELCGMLQMDRTPVGRGLRTMEKMDFARISGTKETHQKGTKAMLWELHPRLRK